MYNLRCERAVIEEQESARFMSVTPTTHQTNIDKVCVRKLDTTKPIDPLHPLNEARVFLAVLQELTQMLYSDYRRKPEPSILVSKKAKKPSLWQRFISRNCCAPSGGFIRVRVMELDRSEYIHVSLHESIDNALIRNNMTKRFRFSYSHKNKPLNLSTTFHQNNIHEGDAIVVNQYPMKGGSSRFLVSGDRKSVV